MSIMNIQNKEKNKKLVEFGFVIWQNIILDYLDFNEKLLLRHVSKYHNKIEIYDFDNIPYKLKEKLTDEILINYHFIKYLNASYNKNITTVNHMKNLRILHAYGWSCGISDEGLKNVNLIELYAGENNNITTVNHMTNLQKLSVYGCAGISSIGDDGLKDIVNLITLAAMHNKNITTVNHMTKLEILYANGLNCGIGDEGLKNVNLVELYAAYNKNITTVNHMTNLQMLSAYDSNCGIGDEGLIGALNLVELYSGGNNKITVKINKIN